MKYENAKIVEAGLYYVSHFGTANIRLELETRDGGANVTIPIDKIEEFLSMFEDDINLEDGFYIHHLRGFPVRMLLDGTGKITAIGDILSEKDEMLKL